MIFKPPVEHLSEADQIVANDQFYANQGLAILAIATGMLHLILVFLLEEPAASASLSVILVSVCTMVALFAGWQLNWVSKGLPLVLAIFWAGLSWFDHLPASIAIAWLMTTGLFCIYYTVPWVTAALVVTLIPILASANPVHHDLAELIGLSLAAMTSLLLALSYTTWQKSTREGVLQSSQAKTEFLSGMSHELRTPLNAIMGFADVLAKGYAGQLSERQAQYVDNVAVSSRHMLTLVNDLLDISRIESGKTEFTPTPVNVGEVLATCVRLFEEDCERRQLSLDFKSGIKRDTLAMLDEVKFRQILLNLLSNSLKFSLDGGTIKVEAGLEGELIRVAVTDNGKGIPEEHHQRIFERFYQVNSATDNKSPGTGLGLPISRYFAELHGGRIFLDRSGVRTQTRFIVELPFVPTPDSA